jgi:hypothetical protein
MLMVADRHGTGKKVDQVANAIPAPLGRAEDWRYNA